MKIRKRDEFSEKGNVNITETEMKRGRDVPFFILWRDGLEKIFRIFLKFYRKSEKDISLQCVFDDYYNNPTVSIVPI